MYRWKFLRTHSDMDLTLVKNAMANGIEKNMDVLIMLEIVPQDVDYWLTYVEFGG